MTEVSRSGGSGDHDTDEPVRSLVLLRHAKAERPGAGPDADRPLTARGHADAAAAGAWLALGGYLPAVVICSPAKRTRQTWQDAALGMAAPPARRLETPVPSAAVAGPAGPPTVTGGVPTVRYHQRAYHGHAADLLELVRSADPAATTLLLVGHNPAISELSTLLDPVHADPDGLRTGGIVIHRIDGGWADVPPEGAPIVKWHTARA